MFEFGADVRVEDGEDGKNHKGYVDQAESVRRVLGFISCRVTKNML